MKVVFIYMYILFISAAVFIWHSSCHELIGSGLQPLRPLPIGSHKLCLSEWSQLVLQLNVGIFLFGFLFSPDNFSSHSTFPHVAEVVLCNKSGRILQLTDLQMSRSWGNSVNVQVNNL